MTWNPDRWPWETLAQDANQTARGSIVKESWSCVTKQIRPRDRVFLMMVGKRGRGIIASGWANSESRLYRHWDEERAALGEENQGVDCEWEKILDYKVDRPLSLATLQREFGEFEFNWTPQGSGIHIPEDLAEKLEALWTAHVGKSSLGSVDADEELIAMEGELRFVMIRHRRREQNLRSAKIQAALKTNAGRLRCEVPGCGFDFCEVYGELGREFAHVHHLKPLGDRTTPSATQLGDLAIVCANCHAMIHLGGACRSLEGLIQQK